MFSYLPCYKTRSFLFATDYQGHTLLCLPLPTSPYCWSVLSYYHLVKQFAIKYLFLPLYRDYSPESAERVQIQRRQKSFTTDLYANYWHQSYITHSAHAGRQRHSTGLVQAKPSIVKFLVLWAVKDYDIHKQY
jgi:hypothetical protein